MISRFHRIAPDEEPNYGPIADVFFIVLMAVLLRAVFVTVQIDTDTAAESGKASQPRPAVQLRVGKSGPSVDGSPVTEERLAEALRQSLTTKGEDACVALVFDPEVTSIRSWELRARLQHEWNIPFVELPPASPEPISSNTLTF